jgi:hypothetical protein
MIRIGILSSVKTFAKYGINEFQTPMEDRVLFSKTQQPKPGSSEALQVGTYPYRVTYPVNTLAKFTHNSGLIHWRASLRVLGYLNTTKNYCI